MKTLLILVIILCCEFVVFSQVTIKGTVLGADSKPIQNGIVAFTSGEYSKYFESKPFSNGKFTIDFEDFSNSNPLFLLVSAPFHVPTYLNLPKYYNDVIEVEIKLQALMVPADSVKIISDLDSFDFEKAKLMTKNNDGTFSYEFFTSKKELKYQIIYSYIQKRLRYYKSIITTRSSHGTMGELSEDMSGDFISTLPVNNGKVTVVLDPSKLLQHSEFYANILTEPINSRFQVFFEYTKLINEYEEKLLAFSDSLNPNLIFNYDISKWDKYITSKLADPYNSKIKSEFEVYYIQSKKYYDTDSILKKKYDSSFAQNFYDDISYSNSLWTYRGEILTDVLNLVFKDDDERKFKEIVKFCKVNKDLDVKFGVYFTFLHHVSSKNSTLVKSVYEKAMADLGMYENLHILQYQFNPDKKLTVGNSVPDFEISLIDSSDKIISNKSLLRKYYLIDFWATWSQTSILELPKLLNVYEKFKGKKGFTILGLSFDNKEETVLRFKNEYKYSMPWYHGFVKRGFNNKLAELFEVGSIPKRILIDELGNVVAINEELRGSNLEKTLKKFLE